jgi:glycosyltransferase involved in cell wall biosynthesis
MRLVIVHNIIAPYRIHLFNLLASSPGIDLHVLFMAETEPNRHWDPRRLMEQMRFQFQVMPGVHLPWRGTTVHVNPGLYSKLAELHPDVIIVTSLSASTAICLLHRARTRAPVIVWWAGTALTEGDAGGLRRAWRKLLLPRVNAFLCYSKAAARYLEGSGVPASRLYVAGNVTFDASAFHADVLAARPNAVEWKAGLGITESPLLLSVGQLIPRKNHQRVLQVFRAVQELDARCALAVIGTGLLGVPLRESADEMGLRNVVFPGHVQPSELPMYYAAANAFVDLSLRDHWSQVVGEAMAAGLPVLVSNRDHAHELVEDEVSGFVLDPVDTPEAARISAEMLLTPRRARQMGEAAYRAVEAQDVRRTVTVFLKCLAEVKSGPRVDANGERIDTGFRP